MADKLVLDLETKKSFDEVGGQHNRKELGVSLCGVYSYNRNEYKAFREEEFKEMAKWLKEASLIIGFNSKSFDFEVLQPYYKFNLFKLPHLDILEEIYHALGHRLKLESVAQATLGEGKSGSGLDALWYFKNNDWEKLGKYCLDDVRVTREVYEYGMRHGHLWYENFGKRETIPIRWKNGQTIKEILDEAYRNGEQIEIEYLRHNNGERGLRKIDIKSINANQIQAYCYNTKIMQVFNIDKIFNIITIGKQENWQTKLF